MRKSISLIITMCVVCNIVLSSCSKRDKPQREHSSSRKTEITTVESTSAQTTVEMSTVTTTTEITTEATTVSTIAETTDETSIETTEIEETIFETQKIDNFDVNQYLSDIDYSGVVLVADDREICTNQASGYAMLDLNTGDLCLNTSDTVFEMGSITKQFTAVAIMQLEEQGLLSTEDTLDKYIPEYPYADKITIHQLLNMTSGIVDYITGGPYGYDLYNMSEDDFSSIKEVTAMFADVCVKAVVPITGDELVDMVSPYELHFEPGTQFEYSNTNYYFLGMVIEQVTGMKYDDYIRENILNPLGLNELWPDLNHINSVGGFSFSGISIPVPHQDVSISYAVGVMTGTAEGLLQWECCVLDGELLTEESWNKIFDGGEFGYGYGWYVKDNLIYHSGMTLGYNAAVVVNRDTEDVVIALSNVQSAGFDSQSPSSKDIAMTIIGNI